MATGTSAARRAPRAPLPVRAGALVASLACAVLLAGPQQASAGWVASGGGGPAAAATALSPGPLPTLSRNGLTGTVTVSWPAVTLAGQPVTGYVVRRYSGTGPSPVTSGTCTGGPVSGTSTAGVVTTTSCTDTRGWTTQTYAYRVVPVFREWLGAESPAASI